MSQSNGLSASNPVTIIESIHDVVNKMEFYRMHMLNDVEEVSPYNVAFNISNYIVELEMVIAKAKWELDRVQG